MKFFAYVSLVLIPFIFLATPDLVSAEGLANVCEGAGCNACHLVLLISNVTKWLIGLLMVIFAIMIVSAGFRLATSAGNVEAKASAKKRITNAIIGIIIVLSAWLIIDILMRALLNTGGTGTIDNHLWSEIDCGSQTTTTSN